ncbi:MAG: hypothetical protein RIT28_1861 [Pseudomonadota bacterium]
MSAVGFALRPLPPWIRAANQLAKWTGAGAGLLTPERLMADAARAAGLPPDFPPYVAETLAVLCTSLREEARLHWFGVMNMRTLLVTGLEALLRVERAFVERPELAETPLHSPVIVLGLPRSGTTYLHRLLSAVPEAAPVEFYRHIHPVPRGRPDLRRARAELEFVPWRLASRVYALDSMHLVRPGLPDECNLGMRLGGRSMIYWATAPTYTYLRWLLAQDLRESYALYRKVLILHQRAAPGRRLTLKCPHHLAWLPALAEAIPEAQLVLTHRDPVEAVPSECKLVLSAHGISTYDLDWARSVEGNALKIHTFSTRAVEFANGPQGGRLVHVPYRRLVKDPVGLVRDIHAGVGAEFTDAHAARIDGFAKENRQHKHGKNHYTAEQFGLSPARLAQEYSAYRERFKDELARG